MSAGFMCDCYDLKNIVMYVTHSDLPFLETGPVKLPVLTDIRKRLNGRDADRRLSNYLEFILQSTVDT